MRLMSSSNLKTNCSQLSNLGNDSKLIIYSLFLEFISSKENFRMCLLYTPYQEFSYFSHKNVCPLLTVIMGFNWLLDNVLEFEFVILPSIKIILYYPHYCYPSLNLVDLSSLDAISSERSTNLYHITLRRCLCIKSIFFFNLFSKSYTRISITVDGKNFWSAFYFV